MSAAVMFEAPLDPVTALAKLGLLPRANTICRAHYVSIFAAASRSRSRMVVRARHAVWQMLRDRGYSYPEIAGLWGVDHSTVMDALKMRAMEQHEGARPRYKAFRSRRRFW